MRFARFLVAAATLASLASCSSHDERARPRADRDDDDDPPRRHASDARSASPAPSLPDRSPLGGDDDLRRIYLVSDDGFLYSFQPAASGTSAYHRVGPIACADSGHPASMGIDRSGWAWIFYTSGAMHRVSLRDATCFPTPYRHPIELHRCVGMAFTARSPGSQEEDLFADVLGDGLVTFSMPKVELSKVMDIDCGELTGGADARLFHLSETWQLGEIDRRSKTERPIHSFTKIPGSGAFAFARYAGIFYLFTSSGHGVPSQTTEYDPTTGTERVRDANIGFIVVGAGQSTLVGQGDKGGGISGTFSDDPHERRSDR